MRFAGTWRRYSKSAMPQLTKAATYHLRSLRFRRWAYQAKVMNTFDSTSSPAVRRITGIVGPLPHGPESEVLVVEAEIGRRADRRHPEAVDRAVGPERKGNVCVGQIGHPPPGHERVVLPVLQIAHEGGRVSQAKDQPI